MEDIIQAYEVYTNAELILNLYKEITKTNISALQGGFHQTSVDLTNLPDNDPVMRLKVTTSVTNPSFTITTTLGDYTQTCSVSGSYVNGDIIVLDSSTRQATYKSGLLVSATFPTLKGNRTNIIKTDTAWGTFELDYQSYDPATLQKMELRTDFSISSVGKRVLLPKKYSTSPAKEYKLVSKQIQFDFTIPYYGSNMIDIFNSNNSYRTEIDLINIDTSVEKKYYICNCQFDINLSGGEANQIDQKITGYGVMI